MSGPDYHAWTHRPKALGGTDPIEVASGTVPFFRAYRYDYPTTTVTNTSDAYFYWDRYQTSDSSKMATGGWDAGTPDTFNRVNLKASGLYSISVMFQLQTGSPFTGNIGIALEGATSEEYPAPFTVWPCTLRAGDSESGQWAWTFIQSYPPVWSSDTGGMNSATATSPLPKNLRINFANNSGASVNIQEVSLEIHLLYEFDYENAAGSIQSQA